MAMHPALLLACILGAWALVCIGCALALGCQFLEIGPMTAEDDQ